MFLRMDFDENYLTELYVCLMIGSEYLGIGYRNWKLCILQYTEQLQARSFLISPPPHRR